MDMLNWVVLLVRTLLGFSVGNLAILPCALESVLQAFHRRQERFVLFCTRKEIPRFQFHMSAIFIG